MYLTTAIIVFALAQNNIVHGILSWGSTEDGSIIIESLTNSTIEGAIAVMRESFFTGENVSTGCDLLSEPGASEELELMNIIAAKDGVSLIARNENNEVVGVCINKINVHAENKKSFLEEFSDQCKHQASKCLVDFMVNMDSRVDLFKYYNTNCLMEIVSIATRTDYQRRGIAQLLTAASFNLGKQLYEGKSVKTSVDSDGVTIANVDAIPSGLSTIMTSDYSQKICRNLHFDAFNLANYREFQFKGKTFSERIKYGSKTAQIFAKPFNRN